MGQGLALVLTAALNIGGAAVAQVSRQQETPEIRNLGTCGLVTRYASTQIGDTCLQDALNVYLDEDAGIVRRKGFAKYNGTALTDTKAVRGAWPFRATDGTEYLVVLSSGTMYQSSGSGSFTAISGLAGRSLTQDMDCAQCLGALYCVNGTDTMFSWNATSTHTVSGAPVCQAVDCFRNRVALANCSSSLSQLRLSGELDGTDYTIPSVPVSTSPSALSIGGANDGNRLIGIMGTHQDVLVLGKLDSTYGLYGFDRRDFTVRELSREVGLIDNRSAREKQGSLYWLSKRGVEKMTGPNIQRVSDPIRDLVDAIITAGGNSRSATDTSQTDFEAGNLSASGSGARMSATITPGSVVPTTFTVTDTSASDFSTGTLVDVSTALNAGAVVLDISTSTTLLWDDFEDGNITANPDWDESGSWTVTSFVGSNRVKLTSCGDQVCAMTTPSTFTYGRWAVKFSPAVAVNSFSSDARVLEYTFINGGSNEFSLQIQTDIDSAQWEAALQLNGTTIGSAYNFSLAANDVSTFTIVRTSTGAFEAYQGSTLIISTTNTSSVAPTTVELALRVDNFYADDISIPRYKPSGLFTSQIFNTGVSTPTGGLINISSSTPGGTGLVFEVRSATSSSGNWNSWTTITNGNQVTQTRQYWMYRSSFTTSIGTSTPVLFDATLAAATTGQFISQCRNPGASITSWGLFQCNSTPYDATFTLAIATGSTCNAATRSTATWNTQTNNTVISIATAPFVAYRVDWAYSLFVPTGIPALHDCTINWNEGTSRPSVTAEVYRDRYYLAYTSGTSGTPVNDHIAVLDSRDQWTLHDAPNCAALGIYNRGLYCGDSGASGRLYQMDVGQDDDGASFTSRIKTKDFDFGSPFQRKILSRIYYDLSGLPDLSYSIDLTPSYTLDASTDTVSLSSIGLDEDYSRFIAAKVPALLSNNVTGRWFNFGLSHTGSQGPWKLFGLRFAFERLKED